MTDFTPLASTSGPGEAESLRAQIAALVPDAFDESGVNIDALAAILTAGDPESAERFGLSWPGKAESRRLALLPPTGTLLPRPDESVEWDSTKNIVIEGDNLEVLRLLRRGYAGKVDVIYIDPPYNTGNDFVYQDSRVTPKDEYEVQVGQRDGEGKLVRNTDASGRRHSAWLDMMHPRLWAARDMLSESGVVIAAIDDTEHANLRLLLDQVFGSENFLANVCWQGGVSALAKHTGGGLDYMLIYAKNAESHVEAIGQWRAKKKGAAEFIEVGKQMWNKSRSNPDIATNLFREWLKSNRSRFDTSISVYDRIDDTGRLFFAGDLANGMFRSNLQYDIFHPVTGRPVRMPEKGWRHEPGRMQANIEAGLVLFGPDETTIPTLKRYLEDYMTQVPSPSFYKDRRSATGELAAMVGPNVFDFPKDRTVLADWIETVTAGKRDATVLDFFAGSGSTGHAVMDLNAFDGGTRCYILVQLGEPLDKAGYQTIADVTRERLRRAGQRIKDELALGAEAIDLGFRSYRLAESNTRKWDGTIGEQSLEQAVATAVDNLLPGRTTDGLLVEMMLRLGLELTTPVEQREVGGSPLYSLGGGTMFAYFGTDITVDESKQIAQAVLSWRDKEGPVTEAAVVVRDTGFADSAAKLNLAAALNQAGITNLRSI